jgi:hypothetical protein
MIDVGCGIGAWLSVAAEKGVNEIQGIDGPWVNTDLLAIPEESFSGHDLTKSIELSRKYDLAMSLEVAEHLPPERAGEFVDSLTRLSDFVLFSAAVPYQGGKNHINEQWQDYWAALFRKNGYVPLDFVRGKIWNDERISKWYRQNIIFYARDERTKDIKTDGSITPCECVSIVHPEMYISKIEGSMTIGGAWKCFRRAIRKKILGRYK